MHDNRQTGATQTRRTSLCEAVTNVLAGFILAFVVQRVVYPPFGIVTTAQTDVLIAAIFTVVSLFRSYVVRRTFERWRH